MEMDDIAALEEALDAAEQDARALVEGLTDETGAWRATPASWSIAECLDHLAVANRVYVQAMEPSAARALARGRQRRGPARPGVLGRWFVRYLEPPVPVKRKLKAPRPITPRAQPPLDDAFRAFLASQEQV